jgi:hypothetical protein
MINDIFKEYKMEERKCCLNGLNWDAVFVTVAQVWLSALQVLVLPGVLQSLYTNAQVFFGKSRSFSDVCL